MWACSCSPFRIWWCQTFEGVTIALMTDRPRERDKRILVGVDDSDATIRALHYLATIIEGRNDFHVCLLHVLPPIPPELLEFGGAEDPEAERQLSEELKRAQAQWLEEAQQAAQPVMQRAQAVLRERGIDPRQIEVAFAEAIHRPDIPQSLLDAAGLRHCGTIVVGRESFPLLQELLHRHVGEELVRKGQGMAIWVVE